MPDGFEYMDGGRVEVGDVVAVCERGEWDIYQVTALETYEDGWRFVVCGDYVFNADFVRRHGRCIETWEADCG